MKYFKILFIAFLVSSCAKEEPRYIIFPENLIESSSDKVSFAIDGSSSALQISNWIVDEKPTSAAFSCTDDNFECKQIKSMMSIKGINTYDTGNQTEKVDLHYDRSRAKKCDSINLGCTVSANSLQMVPNYNQYLNPPLSDLRKAEISE